MKLYCGIDLHSNNGVYIVVDEVGKKLFHRRLANHLPSVLGSLEPFRESLETVAVESTFNWYWLVDGLNANGFPVRLANPAAIDQYEGLKAADDNSDARHLAELSRLGILPTGYIYPRENRSLRDLLRRRMLLVQNRTTQILSVQNLLARVTGTHWSWRKIARLIKSGLQDILNDEYHVFTAEQQLQTIRFLSEKIKMLEERAMKKVEEMPAYEQLLTMPGVGMVLGTTIALETGDIGRFKKPGNFTSYCRCVKARHTSNGKVKGKNNARNGNKYLSWAFVEAAHHCIRNCEPAHRFYQRKKERRNGALATKALASKLTKAAYYMMKNGKPFDVRLIFG